MLTREDILKESNVKPAFFAFEDMVFLDERFQYVQTLKEKIFSRSYKSKIKIYEHTFDCTNVTGKKKKTQSHIYNSSVTPRVINWSTLIHFYVFLSFFSYHSYITPITVSYKMDRAWWVPVLSKTQFCLLTFSPLVTKTNDNQVKPNVRKLSKLSIL